MEKSRIKEKIESFKEFQSEKENPRYSTFSSRVLLVVRNVPR